MRIDEERCPICGDENYEIEDYREEPPFLDNHCYKEWKCICQNGHRFSMSETYLLIERECASMEDNEND